ncbi:hypothetical protein ColLi_01225 [Colletotrichum liriopes]|uniref:SH3 domain-containing protein n=1 Tax=Colletotrichum liriopes TaxID=708192 RepID=A0AA37LNQ6_9PEZI|nr:hypothetical protein ColLi_01225 [Colletotrichum liriopes]
MAHHHHGHRHLPRNPDFWDDVGNKIKDLNPFASDDDDSGSNGGKLKIRQDDDDEATTTRRANTRQGRSTVVKTIYQTVTDGDNRAAPSSSTRLLVAESPLPTRTRSTSDSAETTIAKAGAPVIKTPASSSTADAADSTSLLPSVIEEPLTESIPTTLAIATDAPTLVRTTSSAATADGASAISSASPSATAATEEPASAGPSGAAKAGIAIGVLAGVLVVFLLVFFLFNRRKKQLEQQRLADEDEKSHGFGTAAAVTSQNPRAPRISLRPVTQFLPNLNIDKRASRGPAANMNANLAPAAAALGIRNPSQSAWDRPTTSQSTNPANPFGAQAERINGPIAEDADSAGPGHQSAGSTGSAAIAAAGGPANTTVHRVQLDFKPTLEDEMELRAGQLVRLLHEYDDGWGVVPRTCLSTRAVKPRPPQAQGPPRGHPMGPGAPRGPGPNYPPGQRPMTPQGGPHGGPPYPRPESPARPMAGGGRPASPAGRGPMGPGGRPQSPGPRYQGPPGQRPQSPNGMGGRKPSPPGPSRIPQPSRMNPNGPPNGPHNGPQGASSQGRPGPPMGPVGRKPVPGQAV